MMGTPFVMVYRVSPLTYALGRPRVKVPYFAMVNLIAGEEIVPELVQQDFTAENVVDQAQRRSWWTALPANKMIAGLAEVKGPAQRPNCRIRRTPWIGLPRPLWRSGQRAVMSKSG